MKKIVSLVCLALAVAANAFAAERVQVVFDYTQGIYRGLTYEGIVVDEPDFQKDAPRYEARFFSSFLDNFGGAAYRQDGEIRSDEALLTVRVVKVQRKGDTTAELVYTTADGQQQTTTITGDGGVFGSFLNLFGDGMRSVGEAAAKWLNQVTGKK